MSRSFVHYVLPYNVSIESTDGNHTLFWVNYFWRKIEVILTYFNILFTKTSMPYILTWFKFLANPEYKEKELWNINKMYVIKFFRALFYFYKVLDSCLRNMYIIILKNYWHFLWQSGLIFSISRKIRQKNKIKRSFQNSILFSTLQKQ